MNALLSREDGICRAANIIEDLLGPPQLHHRARIRFGAARPIYRRLAAPNRPGRTAGAAAPPVSNG
jgi:hypothetical protein